MYKTPVRNLNQISVLLLEATMKMIVNFLASKEEKMELMLIFDHLDQDNDGKISMDELSLGLAKVMSEEDAKLEAARIIAQFDTKRIGGLSYSS